MASSTPPVFTDLSHEMLCHIIQYLPLKEVLTLSMLCKKLLTAVNMHFRLRKDIDFCEGKLYGYMSPTITDEHLHSLFAKCPHLETVYGLHPLKVERRRLRKRSALTVPGIIEALSLCSNLEAVETSDLRLFEAIMFSLPKIEIIGVFKNRDGVFPPSAAQRLKLQPYPRISTLHLTGVEIPELTAMPLIEHLHLNCVRFTKLQPFRAFLAQNLKTFVMKHCMGPSLSLRYLSLIIALSSSPNLSRLELVRVPLPGGLVQRAVEDAYRHNGFVNLTTLIIAGCKGILESDVGHLMIVASKNLQSFSIQPSLTRDSLFVSLSFAQCEFPKLKSIHLGYVDTLSGTEEWSNDVLVSIGLSEMPDTPSSLTDSGMKVINQLFPHITSMSVSNCPHLMVMDQWSNEGEQAWRQLKDLTLQRCHCLQLPSFALCLAFLPKIEVLILNDMFREPPKGCSHVGLSAGTGLGMSSAVVSNQDEHIAVQGHQQDFELQAEDNNLENEELVDFMDMEIMDAVDNEENPDQHIMVLQQEFFDDERRIVPPPVRHREDMDPENLMPQNDPENRIRRELNDDYNVALNIETLQVSDMENSDDERFAKSEFEEGKKIAKNVAEFQDEREWDEDSFGEMSTQRCRQWSEDEEENSLDYISLFHNVDKNREYRDVSYERSPPQKRPYSSSDEEDEPVSDKHENGRKKKHVSFEKTCHHSQECRKKCSKGFDPNQPSTSRDGNCLDCTCPGVEARTPDTKKYNAVAPPKMYYENGCADNPTSYIAPSNEPLNNSCDSTDEDLGNENTFMIKKIIKVEDNNFEFPATPPYIDCNSTDEDLVNENISTHKNVVKGEDDNSEDRAVKGAITRHRKRVMDADAKKKSISPSRHNLRSVSDRQRKSPSTPPVKTQKLKPSKQDTKPEKQNIKPEKQNIKPEKQNVKPKEPEASDLVIHKKIKVEEEKNGKHKRHRHNKKYRRKCDKLCRRHYPFTRSRRNKGLRDGHNAVSQGTQATSADIRRSLRKQRNCSNRCRRRTCTSSHKRPHNHISAKQQFKRTPRKTNADSQSKSTSTSDPLMEDDAVQVLRLVSETLISLTIISCGISDVVIDHCQSLTHVEVQACRILKMFQLHYCPSLQRLNVSQCPKLTLEALIPETISYMATKKILVTYEPCMQKYNPAETEKLIFSKAPIDINVVLFHDFTDNANESLQAAAKENLFRWMEVAQKLFHEPSFWLLKHKKKNKVKSRENRYKYPYGHNLIRVHGVFTLPADVDPDAKEWRYEILTNDHIFAAALENVSWDDGFPTCDAYNAFTEQDALQSLFKPDPDRPVKKLNKSKKIMGVYIPVCKSNLLTE